MAMESCRPALRVFDNQLAKSFYLDWLAFQLRWEHRPQDGGPSMMEVKRDNTTLVLSEHYGDGTPGTKVFIEIDDLDSLHQELTDRQNPYMRPGIEVADWGRILTVIDPFGNKLVLLRRQSRKSKSYDSRERINSDGHNEHFDSSHR